MESEKTPGEAIGMFISLAGTVMMVIGAFKHNIAIGGTGGVVALLGRVIGSIFK